MSLSKNHVTTMQTRCITLSEILLTTGNWIHGCSPAGHMCLGHLVGRFTSKERSYMWIYCICTAVLGIVSLLQQRQKSSLAKTPTCLQSNKQKNTTTWQQAADGIPLSPKKNDLESSLFHHNGAIWRQWAYCLLDHRFKIFVAGV